MSLAPELFSSGVRIRVFIADDNRPIRRLVRLILEAEPRFEVCGEVADGMQAVQAAKDLRPDLVIMNIHMPVLDGLAAARKINTSTPKIAIVILSSEADTHFINEAKKAGARGYVVKTKADGALIRAIDASLVSNAEFVVMD